MQTIVVALFTMINNRRTLT